MSRLLTHGSSSRAVPKQSVKVRDILKSLVETRSLLSETVVRTLVMSLGALWYLRLYVQPRPSEPAQSESDKTTACGSSERLIIENILDTFRTLMEVGLKELDNGEENIDPAGKPRGQLPKEEGWSGHLILAQHITATFRRTLPALRIASKWLKCNLEYIERELLLAAESSESSSVDAFWSSYAAFYTKLSAIFAPHVLPSLNIPLEEDINMKGFAPLKRSMFGENAEPGGVVPGGSSASGLHPNQEQLMRIQDLLMDVELIGRSSVSHSVIWNRVKRAHSITAIGFSCSPERRYMGGG